VHKDTQTCEKAWTLEKKDATKGLIATCEGKADAYTGMSAAGDFHTSSRCKSMDGLNAWHGMVWHDLAWHCSVHAQCCRDLIIVRS